MAPLGRRVHLHPMATISSTELWSFRSSVVTWTLRRSFLAAHADHRRHLPKVGRAGAGAVLRLVLGLKLGLAAWR